MILGMMANKEHKEFIKTLKDKVYSIIALDIPNQINFIEKEKLSKIAQSCGVPSKTENSIEEALKNIASENENAIILCAGSLYFCCGNIKFKLDIFFNPRNNIGLCCGAYFCGL